MLPPSDRVLAIKKNKQDKSVNMKRFLRYSIKGKKRDVEQIYIVRSHLYFFKFSFSLSTRVCAHTHARIHGHSQLHRHRNFLEGYWSKWNWCGKLFILCLWFYMKAFLILDILLL